MIKMMMTLMILTIMPVAGVVLTKSPLRNHNEQLRNNVAASAYFSSWGRNNDKGGTGSSGEFNEESNTAMSSINSGGGGRASEDPVEGSDDYYNALADEFAQNGDQSGGGINDLAKGEDVVSNYTLVGDGWCRPSGCDIGDVGCRTNGFWKDGSTASGCMSMCDVATSCVGYAISAPTHAYPNRCRIHTRDGTVPSGWHAYYQTRYDINSSDGQARVQCFKAQVSTFALVGLGWCRPSGCDIQDAGCRTNGFWKDGSTADKCMSMCDATATCVGYAISAPTHDYPNRCRIHTRDASVPSGWTGFRQPRYDIYTSDGQAGVQCFKAQEANVSTEHQAALNETPALNDEDYY